MRLLRGVLLVIALAGAARSSLALTIKALEFDVDGVLPSAESDLAFWNTTAFSESSLFSVSGGLLHQDTTAASTGFAGYLFPDVTITGGGLSSALSTTMEARLRVFEVNTGPPESKGGVFFQAFDGAYRYTAAFTPTGIMIPNASAGFDSVAVDVFRMHTYRFESPGGSNTLRLYIDGVLAHSGTALSSPLNGFDFGDGISRAGNNGSAEWDYVRVFQNLPLTSIPEPSTWTLLGAGLLSIGIHKRRRRSA